MKARVAKKILGYSPPADGAGWLAVHEYSPYNAGQVQRADKAFGRALRRWLRQDPSGVSRPKWGCPYRWPDDGSLQRAQGTLQSIRRGPVYRLTPR